MKSPVFPSDRWRAVSREWLWVYRGEVPTTDVWSSRIPVPNGYFLVERGEARIRAGDAEIKVSKGHGFLSAPGTREQWFAPGTRLLSVGFRASWPDATPLFKQGLNVALTAEQTPLLKRATLLLFRQVHGSATTVTYPEAILPVSRTLAQWIRHDAAFQSWFATFATTLEALGLGPDSPPERQRRRIEVLIAWLNARPLHETTARLPPSFPLGLRRAEQLLQQHCGLGVRAFMERRRLRAAQTAMMDESRVLKDIAISLGFRHASHFTAWFRRHTGVSPSVYRTGASGA